MIQSIPSLIAVLDQAGEIVDRDVGNPLAAVNRAFREALGWRDLELVGRELVELVHESDRDLTRFAIADAADGVTSGELETRWQRADGSYVDIAWTATPVTDTTGRRSKLILVSGVDITERMTRQLEIRRQRDFAHTIRDTIPSYLVAIDHDAVIVEDGVNRAFMTRFGWRAEELADRTSSGSSHLWTTLRRDKRLQTPPTASRSPSWSRTGSAVTAQQGSSRGLRFRSQTSRAGSS